MEVDEASGNAPIYAYYTKRLNKKGVKRWICSGCPPRRAAPGHASGCTLNLIKHQLICPGFPEAMVQNAPGVLQSNVDAYNKAHGVNMQSTPVPASGELKVLFTDSGFKARLFRWCAAISQPFNIVASPEFKELINYC